MHKKTYYYCNCTDDPKKKSMEKMAKTPFREVEADNEGICSNCGYYAIAFYQRIDTFKRGFYEKIYGYEKLDVDNKTANNRKWHREFDEKRRIKKTNMDLQ